MWLSRYVFLILTAINHSRSYVDFRSWHSCPKTVTCLQPLLLHFRENDAELFPITVTLGRLVCFAGDGNLYPTDPIPRSLCSDTDLLFTEEGMCPLTMAYTQSCYLSSEV